MSNTFDLGKIGFAGALNAAQGFDLVINYNWNRWPNPDGSGEPYDKFENGIPNTNYRYQFPCVTLNRYAGNGLFWYEEDLYSPSAYLEILAEWKQEMDKRGKKYTKAA
jgi:hypothetical protein